MELVGRLKSLATDHWSRVLVVTTSVVLVLLIAVTLARLVWLVVDGSSSAVAIPPVAAPAVAVAAPRRHSPDDAARWRLFGDAASPAAPVGGGENAPETSLALQLLGVFSTGDARLAGAVISERGKDGELFRIGAAVPGGATLEKVEADKVLLRRRGQLETLKFDAMPSMDGGAPNVGGERPAAGLTPGFRGLKDKLSATTPTDAEASGDGAPDAAGIAERVKENPEQALQELGLKAAAGGGGYLVGEGANADLVRNLGLRPGDVVLSVNGKSLGNAHSDARLVDEVKASGEARVEIRRGSQTFTVNYPL